LSEDSKGLPIPTRFEPEEEAMIEALKKKTGLSRSEIVRRAVRLTRIRIEETGDTSVLYDLPRNPVQYSPPKKPKK